jgi:hypothetical protein
MANGADTEDLGAEGLLGPDAEGQLAQDVRDRLALATRYLANWYRATKGSDDQALWWQKIDTERAKVERAYEIAGRQENQLFLGREALAAYVDAAEGWPSLWRELKLSSDTLVEPSLLDRAAGIVENPLAFLPTVSEGLAKAVGDSLAGIARQLAPWLIVAGVAGAVYVFRRPLMRLAEKVGA